MAREARIIRQLPVGLWAHHDRYVREQAALRGWSEADVVREALDRLMNAEGHRCWSPASTDPCVACGGTGGQV